MAVLIKVDKIAVICNPIDTNPWWYGSPVTHRRIKNAIEKRRFVDSPGTKDHAARIAYFVENPPEDAIEIDVGVPSMGFYPEWIINDGNHRLAAAIFSGQKHILADVSWSIDYAFELFGVDIAES